MEIIVVSIPPLLGDERATSPHAARHLGAFAVAYGVGLLVVVARPARARTMLPVAIVVAAALVIGAVVDLAQRRIPLVEEAAHLPEVVSVGLVWLLAAPSRRPAIGAASARYSIVTVVVPTTESNSPVRTRIVSSQLPAKLRSAFAW